MPQTARKRARPAVRLMALAIATLLACGLAEIAVRLLVSPRQQLGRLSYTDGSGTPVARLEDGIALGLVVPVPGKPPRKGRYMFAPDQTFYLVYTDNDVLRRDWLDDQGRVANHINGFGLRERDEITPDKPAGQRRIICLGDSFTFNWGVPAELGWVRLLEDELRKDGQDVRTVNCGAAGTVCVDEYVAGLKQRFAQFQPDAVILTICLNDLIPSSGLDFQVPLLPGASRLLDLLRGALARAPRDLDPDRDWVGELLALPRDQAEAGGLCDGNRPFEAMWSQGVPQRSLREAQAWCDARQIPFMVVLWPFLQGLGKAHHYPYQKLHDLVAADCKLAGIAFLDVLPALRSTDDEDLWVTPADPHPNPLAQRLALPWITTFVRDHIHW